MKKHFTVLGIHDGHNASACILRDGKILAAISEERLSRFKNEPGYPKRAIEEVLEMSGCKKGDIDRVAVGAKFMHEREVFLNWSDWYRKGYSEQLADSHEEIERRKYFLEERLRARQDTIMRHLGISLDKIVIGEHHDAHVATSYFASPWINDGGKVLILTMDGSGDGICATVNIGENGSFKRIAETKSEASWGKVYSRLTFLLGMKPWEHEYKVMGLAPYADEAGVRKSYDVLNSLVKIDDGDLTFKRGTQLHTSYCYPYLRSQLENHRFDWMSGAAQRITEELVIKWVKNAIHKTGIRKVACGGGVFMNVKVNLLLMELEEVDDLFVFPSCGDESICMGAAYSAYADYVLQSKKDKFKIHPFDSIYLGPEFSTDDIKASIKRRETSEKYHVKFIEDINAAIAKLLASGEIVARFEGRMEWGARALGNRSILLDPRNVAKVRELNAAIKQRDFWMPFAPTVLAENQNEYLINPTGTKSPYMMLAFRTTEKATRDIAAALHPYDFTARPQILEKETNPKYYNLLKKFKSLTGVGAILNTSFNIHGEPIVCTPDDAIGTFERSGLEFLAVGNYLISKRPFADN